MTTAAASTRRACTPPRRARLAARGADDEGVALLFRSGLSTSPVITDVSGHGLGIAIVKEQVERLGGRSSSTAARAPDDLPADRAGHDRDVSRAARARRRPALPAAAGRAGARDRRRADERPRPRGDRARRRAAAVRARCRLLRLAAAEVPSAARARSWPPAGERAALLVDEVLGDREVLVKDFEPPLVRIRNVAAAGLLGGGELVLVLRTAGPRRRHRRAAGERRAASRQPTEPPWVLVVDDAVTTRAMERGLLELAGYQVQVAVDGLDAWTALKSEHFDLVVSDVDMPRMNGFELTARIRADEGLQDLPVVLVSALEAREDKERGIEVGANAYVVKSSFEQSNLLEIIHRLGRASRRDPRPHRRGLRRHPRVPALAARRRPGLEVVGMAHDGERGGRARRRLKPDVILMDVHMPRMDGFEATRQIMERHPTPIVMATASSSKAETRGALRGARRRRAVPARQAAGPWDPGHDEAARELLRTVKLMAEVKVVRRWAPRPPPRSRRASRAPRDPRVIAIGASTGGPQVALSGPRRAARPAHVPLLLVQHISDGFIEGFVDWLGTRTPMEVVLAERGDELRPGHGPRRGSDRHMGIEATAASCSTPARR